MPEPKQITNIVLNGVEYLITDNTVQTILEVIYNNNGAISSRINDLNDRVTTNATNISSLAEDFEEASYVMANALVDLDSRITSSENDYDTSYNNLQSYLLSSYNYTRDSYNNFKSYVLTTYNNINISYNNLKTYVSNQIGNLNTGYDNLKSYVLDTYNLIKEDYDNLNLATIQALNRLDIAYSYFEFAYNSFLDEYDKDTYIIASSLIDLDNRITDVYEELYTSYDNLQSYVFDTYNGITTYINSSYSYLLNKINENYDDYEEGTYVIANALIDLDSRILYNNSYIKSTYNKIINNLTSFKTYSLNNFINKNTIASSVIENDTNVVSGGAVYSKLQSLIGAAPSALDTLEEIAYALGNDEDLAATLINLIAGKTSKVTPATADDIVKLASDGTLLDSGISISKFTDIDNAYNDLKSYTTSEMANKVNKTGDTMSGDLIFSNYSKWYYSNLGTNSNRTFGALINSAGNITNVNLGWKHSSSDGAGIGLRSSEHTNPGAFYIYARAIQTYALDGRSNGNLTWTGDFTSTYWIKGSYFITSTYQIKNSVSGNRLSIYTLDNQAGPLNVRDLLVSESWRDYTYIPNFGAYIKGRISSGVTTGTSPFIIQSTSLNENLNADLLDGQHGSYYSSFSYVQSAYSYLIDLINYNTNDLEEYSYVTAVALNDLNDRLSGSSSGWEDAYAYNTNRINIIEDYLDESGYVIQKALLDLNYREDNTYNKIEFITQDLTYIYNHFNNLQQIINEEFENSYSYLRNFYQDYDDTSYVIANSLIDLDNRIIDTNINIESSYITLRDQLLSNINSSNTSWNTAYNNLKSYILTTYNNVKSSYDILNTYSRTQIGNKVDRTGDTMTGNLYINLNNTDAGNILSGLHVTYGPSIGFGVGSGKINRGIYDVTQTKWMLYTDGANVIQGFGNLFPTSTNTQCLGGSAKAWKATYTFRVFMSDLNLCSSGSSRLGIYESGAQSNAAGLNTLSILASNYFADNTQVPQFGAYIKGQIKSGIFTGTSPFIIQSTTLNTNLNADLLDGQHGSYFSPYSYVESSYTYVLDLINSNYSYFNDSIATKQTSITTVVNPAIEENGGTPVVSSYFENGLLNFEFSNLKGDKGDKGDTVILGNDEEYTLYNELGENTDGAVTQAKVTELYEGIIDRLEEAEDHAQEAETNFVDLVMGFTRAVRVFGDSYNTNLAKYYIVESNGEFTYQIVPKPGYAISYISIVMDETAGIS